MQRYWFHNIALRNCITEDNFFAMMCEKEYRASHFCYPLKDQLLYDIGAREIRMRIMSSK